MSRSTTFVVLVTVSAFLLFSSASRANVIWSWSFSTEAGTLVTDGTLADTGGNHTFHILSFNVTSSAYPVMVGAAYVDINPVSGFLWNGSTATQFFRSSGGLTNGSDLANPSNGWFYVLFPGTSLLESGGGTIDQASGTLTITPTSNAGVTAIPTLDTNGLVFLALLLGSLGLAVLLLRRT